MRDRGRDADQQHLQCEGYAVKLLILIACLLCAHPAFAADGISADGIGVSTVSPTKGSSKQSCGKTIDECQTKVDADEQVIKELNATVTGARRQRDLAQQALSDVQLAAYLAQQAGKK